MRREENRRKTLGARTRTNNKLNPWCCVRDSNPGHISGRRALWPLHHPCSPVCCLKMEFYAMQSPSLHQEYQSNNTSIRHSKQTNISSRNKNFGDINSREDLAVLDMTSQLVLEPRLSFQLTVAHLEWAWQKRELWSSISGWKSGGIKKCFWDACLRYQNRKNPVGHIDTLNGHVWRVIFASGCFDMIYASIVCSVWYLNKKLIIMK